MTSDHTPRTGLSTIGGWKLGKTLGRGAYAHVRLATHQNGHKAACKILPALHRLRTTPATSDEIIDAVEAHKELVLLKALAGSGIEGIVGLEGVIVEGGWTYIFLTLYNRSASSFRGPWPWKTLVPFFRQLCITIHNLHQLGVSHEDLKRSNILIDDQGQPIAVDFGFSQFNPYGNRVKSAGGTLDYSSPEKVQDLLYDPRANDVWALGILLTKLVGVSHPFAVGGSLDTSTHMKDVILNKRPHFDWIDTKHGPDFSSSLAELLTAMLAKDPKDRITLPKVLRHPYLLTRANERRYLPPDLHLPDDVPSPIPASVIEDICFLAYINKEFVLCESPERIRLRIVGPDPCWEKRWTGFLCRWKQSAEMKSEEPVKISKKIESTASGRASSGTQPQALREIHLSPNVPKSGIPRPIASNHVDPAIKPTPEPKPPSTRRPINGHMKPRNATPIDTDARSDTTLSGITVGRSHVSKLPAKTTRKTLSIKTPDRVDFRAKKVAAPLQPKQRFDPNIPDLASLAKTLEQPAVSKLASSGSGQESENGSGEHSKDSDTSFDEGSPAQRQRQAPARVTRIAAAPNDKGLSFDIQGPARRSRRLQGKENKVLKDTKRNKDNKENKEDQGHEPKRALRKRST